MTGMKKKNNNNHRNVAVLHSGGRRVKPYGESQSMTSL